jgi:hypothetical protein
MKDLAGAEVDSLLGGLSVWLCLSVVECLSLCFSLLRKLPRRTGLVGVALAVLIINRKLFKNEL